MDIQGSFKYALILNGHGHRFALPMALIHSVSIPTGRGAKIKIKPKKAGAGRLSHDLIYFPEMMADS
jgi:hypothetical protein